MRFGNRLAYPPWRNRGEVECPKFEVNGCVGVAVTYTRATIVLSGTDQVTVVATGNAEGCSINYRVILTFVGAKDAAMHAVSK
jgi:hypothetical protein